MFKFGGILHQNLYTERNNSFLVKYLNSTSEIFEFFPQKSQKLLSANCFLVSPGVSTPRSRHFEGVVLGETFRDLVKFKAWLN